jgi:hypothetical protein
MNKKHGQSNSSFFEARELAPEISATRLKECEWRWNKDLFNLKHELEGIIKI